MKFVYIIRTTRFKLNQLPGLNLLIIIINNIIINNIMIIMKKVLIFFMMIFINIRKINKI